MLLAIDIGNTDFTIGVFQGKKLCDTFRMRTKINRTSDEYGVFILNTLQYKGYDTKDVEDVIIASVVPAVMHSFNSAIIKYFGLTPIIVGPGICTDSCSGKGRMRDYPLCSSEYGSSTGFTRD